MTDEEAVLNEAKAKKATADVVAAASEKKAIHILAGKIHREAGGAPSENWIDAERIVKKE